MTGQVRPRSAAAHARPMPSARREQRVHDGVVSAFLLLIAAVVCIGVEPHAALLLAIGSAAAALDAVLEERR